MPFVLSVRRDDMTDWMAFAWVALGVLVSSVLPSAVTALWPAEQMVRVMESAGARLTAREIFVRIWPGVRMDNQLTLPTTSPR